MKSKFEKNSMLKKIVAMACMLALLLSVSIPYDAFAAAKNLKGIAFGIPSNLAESLYFSLDSSFDEYFGYDELPGDSIMLGNTELSFRANLDEVDDYISYGLTPSSGNFPLTTYIYVYAVDFVPQIFVSDSYDAVEFSPYPALGDEYYRIKISTAKIKTDEHLDFTIYEAPAAKYNVGIYEGNNTVFGSYTVSDITSGGTSVALSDGFFEAEENDVVKFKVSPTTGYKIDSVVVSSETFPLKADSNGFYSFKVTKDTMITVTTSKAQYTISGLTAPEGYELIGNNITNGQTTVEYGTTYTFIVTTPDGMEDATVSVDGGARAISRGNGEWSISNITQNVTVTINGGNAKTYTVTMPDKTTGYSIETNATSVAHGDTYTFDIKLDAKYNKSEVSVTATNGTVASTDNGDGTWTCTITNITANTVVSVLGVTRNPFVISGLNDTDDNDGYTVTASSEILADGTVTTESRSYTFYVKADEGYGAPWVSVQGGGAVIANPSEGTYIINNITDDVTVTIEAGNPKKYNVRFINGTGFRFNIPEDTTIVHNSGTLSFSVTLDSAYTQSASDLALSITSGNGNITGKDLKYTITGVTADTTITVDASSIKLNTYTISGLKSAEGSYTVQGTFDNDGNAQVNHGGSYTFYVNPAAGLENPTVSVNNDKTLIKNGNQYTIENVTSDLAVTIKAGNTIAYDVIFNQAEGCSFTDSDNEVISEPVSVNHGGSYQFKLAAKSGYDTAGAVVQVDGKNLTPDANGVYTISNVTANTIVSVSGVTKSVYKVTLTQKEGYTITASSLSVSDGDDYYFTVAVNPGYEFVSVNVTGTATLTDGKVGMCTIGNVKSDVEISVTVSKIAYNITVNGDRFTVAGIDKEVNYGDDLSFTITPDSYYKVTRVTVNGTEYFTDSTGKYTISNVTTNMNINVTTAPVTITINYIGGRWADNKTVVYTYEGKESLDKAQLERFTSSEMMYEFNGWQMNSSDLDFDKLADKTVTLTAQWVDNREFIRANIVLETYHQTISANSVTIRTYVDVRELKYNQVFQGSQILAYGTLLTKADVDDIDIYSLKDYVMNGKKLSGNEDGTGLITEGIRLDNDAQILNYYHTDTVIDPLEMGDNNFIRLAMTGFSEETVGSYKALGWIQIKIGEETIIVFCDNWDTGFTQSTDPKY